MRRKNTRRHVDGIGKSAHSHLEKRPVFYIFCEGEKTEPDYFRALKESLIPNSKLNLKFPYSGAVPYTIATQAVEFKSRLQRQVRSFKRHDQVWAVFDRDHHHKFNEAVRLCRNNDVLIGRSNPCFEIWLILHLQDYDALDDNAQDVKSHFRKLLRSQKKWKKDNYYSELVKYVEDAESRAIDQMKRRRQDNNEYGVPSTTVGHLTVAIRRVNEQYQKRI